MDKNPTYTIDINAPKEKVWELMLADESYREWTNDFHEGSFYDGTWKKGSTIRFLAEDDGKLSGMCSKIVENTPGEYVSIEHVGEVIDGKDVLDSPGALAWAGSQENYTFTEVNGVTTVMVELKGSAMDPEMAKMFDGMWPKALAKLKQICER